MYMHSLINPQPPTHPQATMASAFPPVPVLHALATWFMVGLIWFVQVVHYPLFSAVGKEAFVTYESRHTAATSLVVVPPMLIELATAALLVYARPRDPWVIAGAILVAVIWLSTFLIQVPCHTRLTQGFSVSIADRLVASNWIRTVSWSLRGVIALVVLRRAFIDGAHP